MRAWNYTVKYARTHAHARTRTHTHARTHARTHAHTHTHARKSTCTRTHTYTHAHTHTDAYCRYLWEPANGKKPLCRMTGHVQPINVVSFSPNGRMIASASFDKSIRIWNGVTGKFIATLRGHVGAVYQVFFFFLLCVRVYVSGTVSRASLLPRCLGAWVLCTIRARGCCVP